MMASNGSKYIQIDAKDREGNVRTFARRISLTREAFYSFVLDDLPRQGLSFDVCWIVSGDGKKTRLRIEIPPKRKFGEQLSMFGSAASSP